MKKFDIKERTLRFSIRIVQFAKKIPESVINLILIKQLVRSGTSIGANVEEADGASSRRDFFHKITLARKEARETNYWLSVILESNIIRNNIFTRETDLLQKESIELIKILSSIILKNQNSN